MKTLVKILLIYTIACFFWHSSLAQEPDTIKVSAGLNTMPVGKYFYTRTGSDFQTFHTGAKNWTKINATSVWLSPNNVHWLCAVVKSEDSIDRTLKLFLNNVQAGVTKMYVLSDGIVDSSAVTGSLLALNSRANSDRLLSIPFTIKSGRVSQIYIKTFRKEIGITITPVLHDPAKGIFNAWLDYLLIVVLSFLLLILIIATIIACYFKTVESLLVFTYILFGFFYVLAASGFGSLYVWSSFPRFEENAAVFLGAISTSAFLEFSRRILNLQKDHPYLNRFIICCVIFYLLTGFVGFYMYEINLDTGLYGLALLIPYASVNICFALVLRLAFIKSFFGKEKEYWWFVFIFLSYFLMAVLMTMLETGNLKFNYEMHPVILALGALPQMTLTLIFIIHKLVDLLKIRTLELQEVRIKGMQAILNERLRISRELHDEIGATLSGISMYSHLLREQLKSDNSIAVSNSLNVMQQSSSQMVEKLNDIVWLINPEKDSLQQLINRLEDYAINMAVIKDMQVKVNVPHKISNTLLPAETRKNIYLFCKEAINNAVKHSGATTLNFSVEELNNCLRFIIEDNGCGFDPEKVVNGNGIGNMRNRAEQMGAKLDLQLVEGKGTTFKLLVKLT